MILEKKIKIKITNSFTINYYNKLGYNVKYKDKIIIPIEHLPKGSHIKITAICDKCNKEKQMILV